MHIAHSVLNISHSPDPDDAFAWWGVSSGQVSITGFETCFSHLTMQEANEACLRQEIDVAAISAAAWPHFADDYEFLGVGASVGRGYGPALAAKKGFRLGESPNAVVALPGEYTTGSLLFRILYPGIKTTILPCNQIAEAIIKGEVQAGVLIHEDLLNYEPLGLEKLSCLGREWFLETGLPIPVGLIAVRKVLGADTILAISNALHQSLRLAFNNESSALESAMNHSHEKQDGIARSFINMFTNQDTLHIPDDCLRALRLLYAKAYTQNLIPCLPTVRPIYPINAEEKLHA